MMSRKRVLSIVSLVGMLHHTLSFHLVAFKKRNILWSTKSASSLMPSAMDAVPDGTNDASERELSQTSSSDDKKMPQVMPQKQHTITVCMVPPPSATKSWSDITKARSMLKDPGFYRWPPHANMLYPFIDIKHDLEGIVGKLRNVTGQCNPFQVSLDTLGTFGGKNRGVLWLYPRSHCSNDNAYIQEEPLIQLQAMMEQQFPMCTDQRKNGRFTPHMTLSHFPSLEEAKAAQTQVETWWPNDITFDVNEIYLLQRTGDDGQFLRVATIALGEPPDSDSTGITIHDPPVAFPDMPLVEEEWVRDERMNLKKRRNGAWSKGRRRRGVGRRRSRSGADDSRGPSRSRDTPEEISAKRAVRKEKRERLERERLDTVRRGSND